MSSHSSAVLAIPSVAFPERRYTGYRPNYTRPYPLLFLLTTSDSMPCLLLILLNLAITFLAQWHPLIQPKMNTFRGSADWSGAD